MLYVGIDIAKRSHTALALQVNRQWLWSDFEFANNRDGFESLLAKLTATDEQAWVTLFAPRPLASCRRCHSF